MKQKIYSDASCYVKQQYRKRPRYGTLFRAMCEFTQFSRAQSVLSWSHTECCFGFHLHYKQKKNSTVIRTLVTFYIILIFYLYYNFNTVLITLCVLTQIVELLWCVYFNIYD
jgi:hypothetical protein